MAHVPALLVVVLSASAHGADFGRQNYIQHCVGCHQMSGEGSPEHGVPRMNGVVGHFLRLPEGREFLVKVPGTSQAPLGDAEVAELLNWMLRRLSPSEIPPDFLPYTGQEVQRLRAAPLADVMGTRAQIVERLNRMGYAVR